MSDKDSEGDNDAAPDVEDVSAWEVAVCGMSLLMSWARMRVAGRG